MNGKKAKALRKENGVVKKAKVPTPPERRMSQLLRQGPGRRGTDEYQGTPKSQNQRDRYYRKMGFFLNPVSDD